MWVETDRAPGVVRVTGGMVDGHSVSVEARLLADGRAVVVVDGREMCADHALCLAHALATASDEARELVQEANDV